MPVSQLPDLPKNEVAAEQRKEQIDQIRDYYAALARVDDVAFRIRVANREFCKKIEPRIGLYAATVRSLPRKYRSYSHEALQLSWTKPTAITVAGGSPAALAGIKTGDQILTLDNEVVPASKTAKWMEKWLRRHGTAPVKIMVRRDGIDTPHTVTPVMGCAIPIDYVSDPTPNAFTDSKKIVIYSGILRVAPSDADLAVIVGHELAHVNMGHYDKKVQNALIGKLGGALIDGGFMLGGIYTGTVFTRHFEKFGAKAFSVQFEREADYVGAYYAARAGYDISGAAAVWRRFSLESPNSIRLATTHPISPARFVQMQKVIAEIAEKKRLGLPLVPNIKTAPATPQPASQAGY
jgi:Zn-dependent protease with chaperone function